MLKTKKNIEQDTLYLGSINEPLMIFGGVYSNLQAAEALRDIAEKNNIPPEQCICTGDIVAYCGQPAETIDVIRKWGVHCLLGNCEESLANYADDCGCGFDAGSQCDVLSNQWFTFANKRLSPRNRKWFSKLPRHIKFTINQIPVLVVHGSVSSINQFVFSSSEEAVFLEQFSFSNTDLIIGGHSGLPFTKKIGKKVWHNSGAIGMPANDGSPNTWYSLISPKNHGLKIEHKVLTYDHNSTYSAMKENDLHNGYAKGLISGLWPSTDILPSKERLSSGMKIEEGSYFTH